MVPDRARSIDLGMPRVHHERCRGSAPRAARCCRSPRSWERWRAPFRPLKMRSFFNDFAPRGPMNIITIRPLTRRLCAATALALALGTSAQAQSTASEASALSMLPIAVSVAAPVAMLSAGAGFTVVAVEATGTGAVWVLERASDGARASVRLAGARRRRRVDRGRHGRRRAPRSAPAGCCRRRARRSPSSRTRSAARCSTTSGSRDEAAPSAAVADRPPRSSPRR